MQMQSNSDTTAGLLPAEVVFHPSWWHKHTGITFDEDFFFHPAKRVESERKMEQALFDRFGRYGLGEHRGEDRPVVGAVHNAAGYLLSAMLGCELKFAEDAPPEVLPANRDDLSLPDEEDCFKSEPFKRFTALCDALKARFGYLTGDVNWAGVLNTALDLRGQMVFMDMLDNPEGLNDYLRGIAGIIEKFAKGIESETGSSSISVNRLVRHVPGAVYLHSECSVTMISVEQYDRFIRPIDAEWSSRHRPYGIHFCGRDPHRFAESYAALPHLDFLDVGWGGDLKQLRRHLPDTFLNIRLSPVEIVGMTPDEIRSLVAQLVEDAGNPHLTGVCCINMDDQVSDDQVAAIFDVISELRARHAAA